VQRYGHKYKSGHCKSLKTYHLAGVGQVCQALALKPEFLALALKSTALALNVALQPEALALLLKFLSLALS